MNAYDFAFAAILKIAPPLTRALLAQVPQTIWSPSGERPEEGFLILRPGGVVGVGIIDSDGPRTLLEGPAAFESFEASQMLTVLQKACAFFVNEAAIECGEGDDFFPGSATYIAPGRNTIEVRFEKDGESRPLCFWTATPQPKSVH